MAKMDHSVNSTDRRAFITALVMVCALLLLGTGFVAGFGVATVRGVSPGQECSPTPVETNMAAEGVGPTLSSAERQRLLADIWTILEQEYVDEAALDTDQLYYGAAHGLVGAVGDPHTIYIEPVPAAIISEDLEGVFQGIGATVSMVNGELVIVRPLSGSPAERAGLLAGDVILKANDEELTGKTVDEAISIIRGPEGSTVRLLVRRQGVDGPFEISIIRARVEAPVVEGRMLEGGIAYLALAEYNALAAERLHQALEELLAQAPSGLVLDLRGNPGGYLHIAVAVSSEFLAEGDLILTEHERGKDPVEYRAERDGSARELPLVVLVDGGSASAAEITAGALRCNKRAMLVGQTTYGKGSMQSTHDFEDGSSLRVTIARWYLPDGTNLDEYGLVPDIEAVTSEEQIAEGIDAPLQRAVAYLQNGGE
jgi:carboxyl-terminal processing protease